MIGGVIHLPEEPTGNAEGDTLARKNLNIVSYVQSGQLSVRVSYLGQQAPLNTFAEHFEIALSEILSECSKANDQQALFASAEDIFSAHDVDFEEGIEI